MATTPADVAVTLGLSAPVQGSTEYRQWELWITNSLLLLRTGDGVHTGFGDLALLDQESLDYVVREAVAAHARRPDDATSVEIAVDDGRTSRTYQSSTGRVAIRDEWWAMLQPDRVSGTAFSVRPSYTPGARTCP